MASISKQEDKSDKILVIQTGGTIDKCYPKPTGGYAFDIGCSYCQLMLNRIYGSELVSKRFTFQTVSTKDSQDLLDADRQALAAAIGSSDQRKILITHGTDGLIDTANFLQQRLQQLGQSVRVVLVGAALPGAFKDTDADFNLGFAFGFLAESHAAGVFVCMHFRAVPAQLAYRDASTGEFSSLSDKQ